MYWNERNKLTRRRIIAIFIDYLVLVFSFFILILVVACVGQLTDLIVETEYEAFITMMTIMAMITLGPPIFLNRDAFGGQSIGKRAMGLAVVTRRTNSTATATRCLFRNVLLVLVPIEMVMMVFFNQRLGDIVTNTEVVRKNESLLVMKNKKSDLVLAFILGTSLMLITWFIWVIIEYWDRFLNLKNAVCNNVYMS